MPTQWSLGNKDSRNGLTLSTNLLVKEEEEGQGEFESYAMHCYLKLAERNYQTKSSVDYLATNIIARHKFGSRGYNCHLRSMRDLHLDRKL